jgi:formamidopyrimidine-DNA glycosylase
MPELPELQALAEGLDVALKDAEIAAVTPRAPGVLKTAEPPPEALVGRSIERVWRRGKLMGIDTGGPAVVMHLMSAGRLGLTAANEGRAPRTALLDLDLADGRRLRLRELSTTHRATVHVLPRERVADHPPIRRLGPEPLGLDADGWREHLAEPPARLHTALRDGRRVAGIGRCYADEIMWAARLAPFATTSKLPHEAWPRLAEAAELVLQGALRRARERIDTDLPNREKRVTAAHGHHGDPCLRCGGSLARVSFADYELVYCPSCQTGGRAYADRRRSRLLR